MKYLVLTVLALISACATVQKDWVATGGSKADGVVRLSHEVTELEQAQLDESQGIRVAVERCKVWGYSGADPFGGVSRRCNATGGFTGCRLWVVTKEYQCTGQSSTFSGK